MSECKQQSIECLQGTLPPTALLISFSGFRVSLSRRCLWSISRGHGASSIEGGCSHHRPPRTAARRVLTNVIESGLLAFATSNAMLFNAQQLHLPQKPMYSRPLARLVEVPNAFRPMVAGEWAQCGQNRFFCQRAVYQLISAIGEGIGRRGLGFVMTP